MRLSFAKCLLFCELCILVTIGCADGPLHVQLAGINPYVRQKWDADESFGPTFHTRVREIQAVRRGADQYTPREQQQLAAQLTEVVQFDKNPLLRREAARALGSLSTPSAVPGLRMAIRDGDSTVKIAACEAWGERGGPEAIELLSEILASEEEHDVRMIATEQLGNFSEPTAVEALGLALDDSDPALQHRAIKSLEQATKRDYGNNVVAWREYLRGGNPGATSPSLVERVTNWF